MRSIRTNTRGQNEIREGRGWTDQMKRVERERERERGA